MRMAIRGILAHDPNIEVVGVASDGIEGVEKALSLKPDLVTMDVEMPRMDGISALKEIMKKAPTRVLMVSTLTNEGAKATFEALEAGAIDYIPKNVTDSSDAQKVFKDELLRRVKESAISIFANRVAAPSRVLVSPAMKVASSRFANRKISCVGIGASTGGPVALQEVLSRVPVNFPFGIMVAIHMPKAFTGPYAERLNSKCSLNIKEAVDGDVLKPGQALIAPGGRHSLLVRQAGGMAVKTVPTSDYPKHLYIPSVDLMLTSLADVSNGAMLGVVLTGMGNDGFKGMQHLKSKGGVTLVQDEATSTIYGMPKACVDGGVADEVLPLGEIGFEIGRIAG
ncbi:chemotaxis response regulator protein-glutamate methylesterase of group 1 operon [Geobacter sp. OR-1]|uniref:protein-glutamate methylesterase/protein-glutamine glutaminase n=1 Tax=Geobacter sp. OR-1 TaxID=1266765 RepID=UPI000543B805|nr:chemotaxis response regulator protein-glutamate methylesterase of group 1 operon [Geobacter sp. OR-1]